jgi:ParB family transcriptional regulator, chromosome partitioning protein
MNKRRGGLAPGSGLGALLPEVGQAGGVREVAINSIRQNPRQPRTYFDKTALDELAASIREHGIIQPLIVSERAVGQYELVAGERRWRAAQLAELERVPVIVRETTPQELLELALIENVQRADLNPLEEARAYQSLIKDFGLSDSQVAERVGKSRVAVVNTRRLLNLSQRGQEAITKSEISAGHGRALLKLENPDQQQMALTAIIANDLSVRETEYLGDLVNELDGDVERAMSVIHQKRAARSGTGVAPPAHQQRNAPARSEGLSPDDLEIKREMEHVLGTPVHVVRTDKDLRVTMVFHTEEKFQEFLGMLSAR